MEQRQRRNLWKASVNTGTSPRYQRPFFPHTHRVTPCLDRTGCCCLGGSEACLSQTRLKEQKEQHTLLLYYQAGLLQSASKEQPLGEAILLLPFLEGFIQPFVRVSPCHRSHTTYSNSYRKLSESYGKYKDVTVSDSKPEGTIH